MHLFNNALLRVIHVMQQEQEAAEAGAAPNDMAEEKLPASGSEDSDDENSLVWRTHDSVIYSIIQYLLRAPVKLKLLRLLFEEEESRRGGLDRNREPQQSGPEVKEGDADRGGWTQAVIEEREVCESVPPCHW